MRLTGLRHAIDTARRICAELESGVVASEGGSEYRQAAIHDPADAARAMADSLTTANPA